MHTEWSAGASPRYNLAVGTGNTLLHGSAGQGLSLQARHKGYFNLANNALAAKQALAGRAIQ